MPARLLILLMLLLLSGCSSQRTPSADPARANEVLFGAMELVGTPYRYGGNTPAAGFDCSGLIGYVYRQHAGINLPRTVASMAQLPAPTVAQDALESGDLVLFATGGRRANHAGIYVGKGRFVHAPSHGGVVRLDRLDQAYWADSFISGKRPLIAP